MADLDDRLALIVAAAIRQAQIDQTPCPHGGGDRPRADFVDPERCHVPRGETTDDR